MLGAPRNQSNRRRVRLFVIIVAVGAVALSACSRTSDQEYEQQISDLESQLADSQAQQESTQAELETTQEELDSTSSELAAAQEERRAAQAELETTQAELLDAQAQLAKAGELLLEDGTYQGPVLAAKVTPYRVILFDSTGAWRIAQVADDAKITSGGKTLTLSQFAKLLQSTDPADINLVNGFYKVKVKNGVVTTLQKSTK